MADPREYLSLDKAAERLGWKGQGRRLRLKRVLKAKERRLGCEIMTRQGVRYRITMPMLHRYCRELFVKPPSELLVEFRRHIESIDERIADIVETHVAPQLEELRAADDELAEGLGRLAKRVDGMVALSDHKRS